MKKHSIIIALGLTLIFSLGVVFASDYDKSERSRKLYGTVEQIPQGFYGQWQIDGRTVLVSEQTKIEEEYGQLKVGSYVEAEGTFTNQVFRAYEIETKRANDRDDDRYEATERHEAGERYHEKDRSSGENEFYGVVNSIPKGGLGTWLIGEREVFVDQRTRIDTEDGPAIVGSRVEIDGEHLKNGGFYARKIETKR